MKKLCVRAALVSAGGLLSAPAFAGGFALIEQSASGMGTAFAGSAAQANDASIQFFNSAGLSLLRTPQVTVAAHAVNIAFDYTDTGSTLPPAGLGQLPRGATRDDAGDLSVIPNLYASMPIGERLVAGLAVTVPFGLKTEYADPWVGRFQGILSEITTLNVAPSIAWQMNPIFSVGAAVQYQNFDAELTNAIMLGAATEGRARLTGDDWAFGWNAGVLVTPSEHTRLGAGYRSRVNHELEGSLAVTTAAGAPIAAASGAISADLTTPDSMYVSVAQDIGSWTLLADASYTNWSVIQTLTVRGSSGAVRDVLNLEFQDTWRVAAGAAVALNDAWTLRFGAAFDESPVESPHRTVRLPDADRAWVSAGARWKSGNFAVDAGYAHLFVDDTTIDLTRGQTGGPASFTSRVLGEYDGAVDIFSLQVGYAFN